MITYLCAECGKKTTWNESFGCGQYIICPNCMSKKVEKYGNYAKALQEVYNKGLVRYGE